MGGGYWDTSAFQAAAAYKAAEIPDFGYSNTMRNLPRDQRTAAPRSTCSVRRAAGPRQRRTPVDTDRRPVRRHRIDGYGAGDRAEAARRPARTTHPGGYVADPQIMIGAIGDDQFDDVPLQVGQFESDNRIDDQLRDIFLEGGGGGDKREGYALAAYFLNTRAQTDAWDKRGRKGYVFFIGDG